jgi:membrane-bound lytic murein transglycosylase B
MQIVSLGWGKWTARASALGLALLIGACATAAPSAAAHKEAPAATAEPSPEDAKFAAFIRSFRQSARDAGITDATYDSAMENIARNQRVEDRNQNQPEFAKPIWSYLDSAVSAQRIADGRQMLLSYGPMLSGIAAKSGVPPEILVSIWGNETNYGQAKEGFNMFEALATLAYDGPRVDYARPQLIAALQIMQREKYSPAQMISSWAGAFGQTQFVPTSFLQHAVDGDGDGKIDLWNSPADALASAADVLGTAGWQRGHGWGHEVTLPKNFAYEDADLEMVEPLGEWRKRGVRTAFGATLPPGEDSGAIYLPAGVRGPAFLVFDNFKVILKYNNAASYALAVSTLGDQIANRPATMASWPRDEAPMSRDARIAFQSDLQKLGYDIGALDGVLGHKTRAALRLYQKAHGLPPDGFPTVDLLDRMYLEIKSKGL